MNFDEALCCCGCVALGVVFCVCVVCCSHTLDCDVCVFRLLFSVLIFQVVFTSSEGLVPHMLTKRSSKSRMGEIIEIGDPTVEHATQYLTCRGVTENISSVLNITGTRFKELDATATALIAGKSLEDRRASLFRDVASELQGLGVSPSPQPHAARKTLLSGILWMRLFETVLCQQSSSAMLPLSMKTTTSSAPATSF